MKTSLASAFAFGLVGSIVLMSADNATAYVRRIPALACTQTGSWQKAGSPTMGLSFPYGGMPIDVFCPIMDDDSLPKTNVTDVQIQGDDYCGNGQVSAWACALYWGNNGGVCGTGQDSGISWTGGPFVLHPGVNGWVGQVNGYGYVELYFNGVPQLVCSDVVHLSVRGIRLST